MQMLRYMPMGSGPSEARRELVSSIVGVIDSWEPSVMLGTELGSSGKAVCTLNHQVVYLAPGHGCFFSTCQTRLSFYKEWVKRLPEWSFYTVWLATGDSHERSRGRHGRCKSSQHPSKLNGTVFPMSGTFLQASLLCVLATDQTSCPPHLWVIETSVCFIFVLKSWDLKQSFTMTGFPRCSNFLTVHLVRG